MGSINDKFKDLYFLAKDGMDVLDEGVEPETLACNLLVLGKICEKSLDTLKSLKKQIAESNSSVAEVLDEKRKNPNASLTDFADGSSDMPRNTDLSSFAEGEDEHQEEGDDSSQINSSSVDPSEDPASS